MTIPSPDPFELVGTTIAGKYDVEEIVAQTALSVVYRATHRVWQRRVAIKAFTAPSLSEEAQQQLLASFVEEGRLLMDLSERCASICQARDVSSLTTHRGEWVPYTVLEWLDGECLEVLLRREHAEGRSPRSLRAVVELLNPIAEALGVAHDRGIVHRDVKPGNIFVLSSGAGEAPRTKLLDFGVAKVMRGAVAAPGAVVSQSFTPSYGAPEQFSAAYGTTGPWTDVYALGLIVVELLTGREALQGDVLSGLAAQSCDPHVRPTARTRGAVVTDDVEQVLERALAVSLEHRFGSARALWAALRQALAAERSEAGSEARPAAPAVGPSEALSQAEIHVEWDEPESSAAVDPPGGGDEGDRDSDMAPSQVDPPPSSDPAGISVGAIALGSTIPIALSRRRIDPLPPEIPKDST
ncbi:MAG TPA: serine/threonine-protein kinase [Polyangiaceae bacterium]|jgi:serine/threonine protein kinase|nr:serine/threonine-protein kinase [Polyangiaceae bacterium]